MIEDGDEGFLNGAVPAKIDERCFLIGEDLLLFKITYEKLAFDEGALVELRQNIGMSQKGEDFRRASAMIDHFLGRSKTNLTKNMRKFFGVEVKPREKFFCGTGIGADNQKFRIDGVGASQCGNAERTA